MAATEEKFLSEGNVLVTNARFVVNSQTYALSGVTSVKSLVETPDNVGPIIGVILGFVMAISAFGKGSVEWGLVAIGLVFVTVAGLILWSQKPTHHLVLRTSSGEVRAISSRDGEFIVRVVAALNDAIIARG